MREKNAGGQNAGGQNAGENCMVGQNVTGKISTRPVVSGNPDLVWASRDARRTTPLRELIF